MTSQKVEILLYAVCCMYDPLINSYKNLCYLFCFLFQGLLLTGEKINANGKLDYEPWIRGKAKNME